jgi:hypothetical protein
MDLDTVDREKYSITPELVSWHLFGVVVLLIQVFGRQKYPKVLGNKINYFMR